MSLKNSIAIDFGTSNTLAGIFNDDQHVELLELDPLASDPSLFRTLLYFPHSEKAYYGAEAIQQYLENETEGRLFRSFKSHLPNSNYLGTSVGNRILPLENMVGLFLLEVKKRAEKLTGQVYKKALIGRPARYSMDPVKDGIALHRMKKAAEFAGFEEFIFVPEPFAAAWNLRNHIAEEKLVLIGDFGGGTSDFTLMRLNPRTFKKEDVLSIQGCPKAGDMLDSVFMKNKLNTHFGAQSLYRLPLSSNALKMPPAILDKLNLPAWIVHLKEKETFEFIKTVQKCSLNAESRRQIDQLIVLVEDQRIFSFFEHIEKAKRNLSSVLQCDFIFDEPGIFVRENLTRANFENWAEPVIAEIFGVMDEMLGEAQVKSEDIDLICLTGGTAQAPLIWQALEKRFSAAKLQTTEAFHSVISGLTSALELWEKQGDFLSA
jgi:hypothetical chaperone protein